MSDYTASSVRDLDAAPGAELSAVLLEKLKDLDATRIARDDGIVLRKAVLGLLEIVSTLESRITTLEREAAAR